MSWPSDGLPRYIDSIVAGKGGPMGYQRVGYIYDRANCHRAVVEIRYGPTGKPVAQRDLKRTLARILADLNAGGSPPAKQPPFCIVDALDARLA